MDTDYLRSLLTYDPTSGDLRWKVDRITKRNRINARAGDLAGCIDKRGYRVIRIDSRNYFAHRIAWQIFYGEMPPGRLDHANRRTGDNRLDNLRLATASENAANTKLNSRNTSGFKGVYFRHGKWRSHIRENGRLVELGSFETPQAAHAVYAEKATEIFGAFARAA